MKVEKKRILLNLDKRPETVLVAKALSSEIRLEILRLLIERSSNISDIASVFGIPLSSAALHVRVLEEAGLISIKEMPGVRGVQKFCGIAFEDIYFDAFQHTVTQTDSKEYFFSMPIGNYFDCDVSGSCGIVSDKNYLGTEDAPYGFYSSDRADAQLLWFSVGYIEYRFPNYLLKNGKVNELSFSFEICSEAPGYQNDWPSDISVWINGALVTTLYSAGNYGGRRGRLNPEWWSDTMTQYGVLKEIAVNETGCYLDSVKCSNETLQTLMPGDGCYLSLRIGVLPDAKNVGGLNLFGDKFGDHPQAIVMKVVVENGM